MGTCVVNGTFLECTGQFINSTEIKAAIDANPIIGTALSSTTGETDSYIFNANIRISTIGVTDSTYTISNQHVAITGDFEVFGVVRMGIVDGNNTSNNGGALSVTGKLSVFQDAEFYIYGSRFAIFPSGPDLYDDSTFVLVDSDARMRDSPEPSFGDNQTIDYSRSRVHHSGAVGLKIYNLGAAAIDAADFTLDDVRVESCTFGIQVANGSLLAPVFNDVKLDTCTFHLSKINNTTPDVTLVNPDFLTARLTTNYTDPGGGVVRLEFRYGLTVNDMDGNPLEDVTVRLQDQNGDSRFDTLTDASGNPSTFPENTFQAKTYNAGIETDRINHSLTIRKYDVVWQRLDRAADSDWIADLSGLLSDTAITQLEATALAHTGITFVDEVSPVLFEGKLFGITVTGNLTTNPSLTTDDIFHFIKAHLSLTATIDGKSGLDWHQLALVGGTGIETQRSDSSFYGGTIKGVRIIDDAGDAFPSVARMQSDDGTFFVAPVLFTAQTTGLIATSRLQVKNMTTDSEIVNDFQATDFNLSYVEGAEFSEGDLVRFRANLQNGATYKEPLEVFIVAGQGFNVPIFQVDWDDVNSFGIDGSTVTEFTADFPNIEVDINDPDGLTTYTRLIAFLASLGYTSAQAIDEFFGAIVVEDEANFRIVTSIASIKLDNKNAAPVVFTDTNRRLFADDGSSIIAATSGSIQVQSGKVFTTSEVTTILDELHQRADLKADKPNTYKNDNSQITNEDFAINAVKQPNGAFVVTRS